MAHVSYITPILFLCLITSRIPAGELVADGTSAKSTDDQPENGGKPASKFQEVCATCHGTRGEGNVELRTPSIAGLPSWYVKLQIEKFQKNFRGKHPEDPSGTLMHGVAGTLNEETVAEVAETIQNLKRIPMKNTLGGNPEKGAEIFKEICIECHRYNASGEKIFRSAPLIGLQDWYIFSQLKKFQAGVRGAVEEDLDGAKMHRVTGTLTETHFKDVAAYIAELAEKYGTDGGRRRRYR